jgi:hypothetical protein
MRNTRREHMFSALPSTTDIRRLQQHVGFVPQGDMRGDLPPSILQPKGKDYVMTLSSGIVILAGGCRSHCERPILPIPLQHRNQQGIQRTLIHLESIGQQRMKGTRNA